MSTLLAFIEEGSNIGLIIQVAVHKPDEILIIESKRQEDVCHRLSPVKESGGRGTLYFSC
jgi:hypothetical protein